jgi:hypothetical protein
MSGKIVPASIQLSWENFQTWHPELLYGIAPCPACSDGTDLSPPLGVVPIAKDWLQLTAIAKARLVVLDIIL